MSNRQIFFLILLGIMVGLGYWVIKPFLVSIAWATILAFVTWPAYRRLLRMLEKHRSTAALIMTTLLIILLAFPVLWLLIRLQGELADAYHALATQVSDHPLLIPDTVARIPLVGRALHDEMTAYWENPTLMTRQMKEWLEPWLNGLAGMVGQIGRNVLKLMITGITLFFFYRDGNLLLGQIREGLRKVIGESADGYFKAVEGTTHAVVYGLIVGALAQGLVAGIGYWIMGIGTPIFLGAMTALTSLIPFIGTVLIWGPIGAWLLLSGHIGAGLGLLAWGAIVVHPIDNILRPLLISSATDIPLLIVLFGVAGGLFAFGMVGLFLGPLILTVLLAIWREWLAGDMAKPATPA
ncbi:MAG: AI-2E family transporter [Candidatus Methylumidiphilus alinenensis]|uniref:AI-2E family transporter n=1 Tax=Candidatus Methylumidiphilus alinenensis TaxID=2202197 RepID=A0A2W4TKL6_9GAMM|nr:MAG: AI-2E family transporter [Candidatus Methylumidiphilus alinenensis]